MKTRFFWPVLLLLGAAACAVPLRAQESVEQGFKNPPASARPHTWWHWINGNITKKGITADLEAMKRAGVGGAQIFNVDVGVPAGKTPFMSPQWREAMAFAMKEAQRLGIEICLHNCAGWSSSGGPWIQPEHAMQFLTWSETPLQGPMRFSGTLPPPTSRLNFYRDIAVFAVRKPVGETADRRLRIQGMNVKAGFERGDHIAPDASPTPEGMATPTDGILLVSDHPDADGKITWDAPAGEWTLIRMGYTPTGETNHPSPQEGLGLECDKLSREAMDAHWSGMMAAVLKDAGPLVGQSLNNALIDSYEVGSQNWTPKFREEFRKRRGYDPMPWLPVVTGRVLGSRETSERFLWDFRRTICDLFADNYFAYFGELCRKNGMKFSVEPYGNGSFDNLQAGGLADIPMGEFWIGGAALETTKLAASAAHTNGRKFVGAESFTADEGRGRWLVEPYSIKALGDRIFSLGINRYIFHRYAHQPWLDLNPGMTMGPWGTHFERTVTWWNQGAAWLRYVGRCQYLLQSGQFAADVLYFAGDEGPNDLPFLRNQAIPFGYDYDGCDATVLQKARVEEGQIVLPSGMRYRLLILPDSPWMTPATLHKIEELTQAGATIMGAKPSHSPSLSGYPACDADVQKMAEAIWGTIDGKTETEHRYGKGRVLWGKTPAEALALLNILPDVAAPKERQGSLVWLHRRLSEGDFYFVANQRYSAQNVEVAFRVTGRRPELWHPETGVIEPASVWREEKGQTIVPLRFGPAESVFVVFRKPAPADHLTAVTLPAGSGRKEPVLEIKEASYEAVDGAGKVDVTQKIAALIASGETSIAATNESFGDPTPLHVKRLRVVYLLDGKRMEQTADENQTLDLGSRGADTALPEMEIATRNGRATLLAWTSGEVSVTTASGRSRRIKSAGAKALPLESAWTVHFPPNLGAPAKITLPRLISWTDHEQPGVRYFSGTAAYETTVEVPSSLIQSNQALYLDLGRVKNIAEVRINGGAWTTLWKAPFRLEVTNRVQSGANRLEVRVTNLWPNRLIGDEQYPDEVEWNGNAIKAWPEWLLQNKPRPKTDRITFTTWRFWQKDSPLLESGLIGPVTLQAVPTIPLTIP